MKTYFALFLVSAASSVILTPLLRRFCERYQLVDEPRDDRRVHQKAVPRLGGVAIFISILIALSALGLVNNVLTRALHPEFREMAVLVGCGLLVLLLGVYDDLHGANAAVKFLALAAVTALFYALGGRIGGLSIPFIGGVTLHPIAGFILTMIWVVGIANAFNLIDGIDGLAAGSALFSSLVLLTISLMQGKTMVTLVALALTGALAGFLRYNFNPASIFLGDSGSLFIGFTLAGLAVQGSQKASTAVAVAIPILACGLPVVDAGVTVARRFVSGKPIFQGDREHIHHMLLARGWSQRRVALVLYGVSALFGLSGMLFVNSGSGLTAVVLCVIGVAVVLAIGHLRYHEVDEIRASLKRNIGERRTRATNNLRLRRACHSVAAAATIDQLFTGVLEILEMGEFAYATAHLHTNGNGQVVERDLAAGNGKLANLVFEEGQIRWSWQSANVNYAGHDGLNRCWCIRLPVGACERQLGYLEFYRSFDAGPLQFDVNYLTTVFQPALTRSAEAIFEGSADLLPKSLVASAT